jgi:CxxC-x17-CxxC domain-containing protein
VSFTDITLACRDCGSEFVFTAGEQEFYAQKGFDNQPTRCQNCRRARKSQRNDSGYSSGGGGYSSGGGGYSSGGGGYSSGGSSYSSSGGGYSNGGGQRERVQYETTCSQCGKSTTVPFVPRGNKPVYCNDCFSQQRGGGGGGGGSRGGGYNRY